MIRRHAWFTIASGLVVILLTATASRPASGEEAATSPIRAAMPSLPPDPCAVLMGRLSAPGTPNRLGAFGLRDQFPARVLDISTVASWTCLSERVSGTLTAVMLRLRDPAGDYAGVWVLLSAQADQSMSYWQDYAESTLRQPLRFSPVLGGFVGVTTTPTGEAILTTATEDGPQVSLWAELQARAEDLAL
jgi:hypothetical protein